MKKTLFHGTTYENYLSIIKEGFNPKDKTWHCSDESEIYFFDDTKDSNCILDYGTIKDLHTSLVASAFESAQITAGIQGVLDAKLVVIEIEIDANLTEDDYSCDNMMDIATVVNIDNLEIGMIKNVHIAKNGYNPHLRFFYIGSLINNKHLNTWNFSDMEEQAMNIIAEKEVYIDDLTLVEEWETIQFKALKVA